MRAALVKFCGSGRRQCAASDAREDESVQNGLILVDVVYPLLHLLLRKTQAGSGVFPRVA